MFYTKITVDPKEKAKLWLQKRIFSSTIRLCVMPKYEVESILMEYFPYYMLLSISDTVPDIL